MVERHKEIARDISQKVVNEKDYTAILEYLTDNYVYHGLGGLIAKTPLGFLEAIKGFHSAIPDLKSLLSGKNRKPAIRIEESLNLWGGCYKFQKQPPLA
jgi:hypothetical protein